METDKNYSSNIKNFGDTLYFPKKDIIVCFQHVSDTYGNPTISIEFAKEKGADNKWIFKRKRVQITRLELTKLGRVLLQFEKEVVGNYHGADRNRSFKISRESSGDLFVQTSIAGNTSYVHLKKEEIYYLTGFVLHQLKGYGATLTDVINLLRFT